MIDKGTIIIGGSAVAIAAALGTLVYSVYTYQSTPSSGGKPAPKVTEQGKAPATKTAVPAGKQGGTQNTQKTANSAPAGKAPKETGAKSNGPQKQASVPPGRVKNTAPSKGTVSEPASPTTNAQKTPSFDVVRVEPTGEAIVAGRSQPGAQIELLNNGKPIAKTKSGPTGQFVIIPESLKPGAHQLSLRATDKNVPVLSKQGVAISVPKPGGKDVMVALAEPDKPTKILSDTRPVLQKPASQKKSPAGSPAKSADPTADPQTAKPEPGQKIAAARTSDPAADATVKPKAASPANPANGDRASAQPSATKPSAPQKTAKLTGGSDALPRPATAPAETPPQTATKPSPQPPANKEQANKEPTDKKPLSVVIRTVEAEQKGGFFVSGYALPGSRIRIYLNRSYIAEVQAGKDQRWSMRVAKGMKAGRYSVRADMVGGTNGAVVARAQVPFVYPESVAPKVALAKPKTTGTPAAMPGGATSKTVKPEPSKEVAKNAVPADQPAKTAMRATAAPPPAETQKKVAAANEDTAAQKPAGKGPQAGGEARGTPTKPAPAAIPPQRLSTARLTASSPSTRKIAPAQVPKQAANDPGTTTASKPSSVQPKTGEPAQSDPALAQSGSKSVPPQKPPSAKVQSADPVVQKRAQPATANPSRDTATAFKTTPGSPSRGLSPAVPADPVRTQNLPPAPRSVVRTGPASSAPAKQQAPRTATITPTPKSGEAKPGTPDASNASAKPPAHVVIEKLRTKSVNKGDSLWRISRRLWGRGIRYTQIYEANTDQIRDPHLIYPGQVLVVPRDKPEQKP